MGVFIDFCAFILTLSFTQILKRLVSNPSNPKIYANILLAGTIIIAFTITLTLQLSIGFGVSVSFWSDFLAIRFRPFCPVASQLAIVIQSMSSDVGPSSSYPRCTLTFIISITKSRHSSIRRSAPSWSSATYTLSSFRSIFSHDWYFAWLSSSHMCPMQNWIKTQVSSYWGQYYG